MRDFKQFYYKMLLESPKRGGEFIPMESETENARIIYNNIIENSTNYKLVYTTKDGTPIDIWEEVDGNDYTIYFVPKNGDDFIYGYVTYELFDDGGIETTSVYNRPIYHGLAQLVYNKYLIPTYRYVMSNSIHSNDGRKFWEKLVMWNIGSRKIEIWDNINQKPIQNVRKLSELVNYYGNSDDFENLRIKIYQH